MPEEIIRETISITKHTISEEDKEISAEYNKFVKATLVEARKILVVGTRADKMRIVLAGLSSAARLASVDSKIEIEQARNAFEGLVDSFIDVEEVETLITGEDAPEPIPEEFLDVEAKALPRSAHDQSYRYGDEEA